MADDDSNLEAFVSTDVSLHDHLTAQMQVALTAPADRVVATNLIDMVDDAGYLQGDLRQLADKLGVPLAMIDRVLAVLQTFEPTGVFARSLAECLALQLKE